MDIKESLLSFMNSRKGTFFKKTNELSEKQLDSFISQIFSEIIKNVGEYDITFDEVVFIQNFDRELKENLKLELERMLEHKMSEEIATYKIKKTVELVISEFKRIKNKIFDENFRREIIDSGCDIDAKFNFYYDETNNPRKFWIKQKKFNSPVDKNFVLGGVVIENEESIENFNEMKNILVLPKNINELKSKYILKPTFLNSLKSENLTKILKWICGNEIYIHFINIDILDVIVKDILSIIIDKSLDSDKIKGLELLHGHALYKHISGNINKVCELLVKYNYPKIHREAIPCFCQDWVALLKRLKSKHPFPKDEFEKIGRSIMFDELWKMFDQIKSSDNFDDLSEDQYIVSDYANYYLMKPEIFTNSFHIFDEESEVEKIIDARSGINFNGNRNYTFKNSIEEELVQISDVIVGLLSRLFAYIEGLNGELENGRIVEKLIDSISKLNKIQKENFLLLINIMRESQEKNKLFFYSENTFVQKNNLDFILSITDITDEMIKFKASGN